MGARRVNVGSYTRKDGTHVGAYSQTRESWKRVGTSAAMAGSSALALTFDIITFGFNLIATLLLVLTAILSLVTGVLTYKATKGKHAKGRKRGATGRGGARRRPTSGARRRPTARGGAGALWAHIQRKRRRRQQRWTLWRRRTVAAGRGAKRAALATGRGARRGAQWVAARIRAYRERRAA